MTQIPTPRNDGFLLQNKVVRQDWFRALSEVLRRSNTADNITTLADDSVTISNPPTQAEVQAIAAKMDALLTALK